MSPVAFSSLRLPRLNADATVGALVLALYCFVVVGLVSFVGEHQRDVHRTVVVDLDDAAETSGQESIVEFAVDAATTTTVQAAASTVSSWECQNSSATNVFRVNEGATSTAAGIGPYCSTCAAGARFSLPVQRVFVRASSGSATLQCSRLSSSTHQSAAGGGGLSPSTADATYLRLDATNDPVTGELSISRAGAALATPSLTAPPGVDFALGLAAASGRGLVVSGAAATTTDNGVQIVGSQAAASGRTSVLVSTTVQSATDRYPLRVTSLAGDAFRVAGNGNINLPVAGSSIVFSDGTATTSRPTAGAVLATDTVVTGTPVSLAATLAVGSYRFTLFVMNEIVGGTGGDGIILNQAHSGGLVFGASSWALVQNNSGAPLSAYARLPITNNTTPAAVNFWGNAGQNVVRLEGVVTVTSAGTFSIAIARLGAPTSITVYAGTYLLVERL